MSDPPFCTEADAAKTSGARLEKCFALIVRLCLNRFNVVSREEFNAHERDTDQCRRQTEYAGRKNIRLGGIAPVKINDRWFIRCFLFIRRQYLIQKFRIHRNLVFWLPIRHSLPLWGAICAIHCNAPLSRVFPFYFWDIRNGSALIFPSRHIFHRLLNMPFYQCYPSSHKRRIPFF